MSSKRRYWIVCNYTACQHAVALCFLGRAWLVTIRYAIRHADRLANEIFRLLVVAAFAVYVRGIIGLPACQHAAVLCFLGRAWLIATHRKSVRIKRTLSGCRQSGSNRHSI